VSIFAFDIAIMGFSALDLKFGRFGITVNHGDLRSASDLVSRTLLVAVGMFELWLFIVPV